MAKSTVSTGLWDGTGFAGEGLLGVFCLLSFEKRILQYFIAIIPDIAVWSCTAAVLRTITAMLFFAVGLYFQGEANCFFYQLESSKESSYGKWVGLGGTIPVVTTQTQSWQPGVGALATALWAAPPAPGSFRSGTCVVTAMKLLGFLSEHLPTWNSAAVTVKLRKPMGSLGLVHRHTHWSP